MKDSEASQASLEDVRPDVMQKTVSIAKAVLYFLLKISSIFCRKIGKTIVGADPLHLVVIAVMILAAGASVYCAAHGY